MVGSRLSEAKALVEAARSGTVRLRPHYEVALSERNADDTTVRIEIKGILEQLRSALDYCAAELHERFAVGSARKKRVYFPIAPRGSKSSDFLCRVRETMRGVENRQDIVDLLSSFQEFSDPDNDWLPDLRTVVNENKHERLTPQRRTERERIQAQSSAGTVSWLKDCVSFGPGVSILGVPINQETQRPEPSNSLKVSSEIWVNFLFEGVGRSVLPFLDRCVAGVESVVQQVDHFILEMVTSND